MRTHEQIITDGNGPSAVGRLIGVEPGTVKQWRRSDSIPAPHWKALVEHKLATLEELADAAAARRTPTDTPAEGAAAA